MMRKRLKVSPLLFIIVFTLLFSACSYHVLGSSNDKDNGVIGSLPGNVSSLAIPFFDNGTRKPNVEAVITTAVANEFMSSVDVVASEDAEALLLGTIRSYKLKPVSFTASDVVQEYRLYVEISFFMVRTSDDKVLWRETRITDYEDFVVDVNNIAASNDAEWNALKAVAFDIARVIKERILEKH